MSTYEGKIIRLRPLEWADAEIYRKWVNDPEIMSLVDRVLPVTAEDHRRWYEALSRDSHTVIFAVDSLVEKNFIGCVWLYSIDYRHRHAEVRIVIGDKRSWGKGGGREALRLLSKFAFEKLNLHKVYAFVLSTNQRALDAFEKIGFSREGLLKQERFVDGDFVDVIRFGLVNKA
jgi:ribosomal-protein-alanine N-acetyltransferase